METTMLEAIISRYRLEDKRPMGGINFADPRIPIAEAINFIDYYESLLEEDVTGSDSAYWETQLSYWEGVLDAI